VLVARSEAVFVVVDGNNVVELDASCRWKGEASCIKKRNVPKQGEAKFGETIENERDRVQKAGIREPIDSRSCNDGVSYARVPLRQVPLGKWGDNI
jgi:hypothetical protein